MILIITVFTTLKVTYLANEEIGIFVVGIHGRRLYLSLKDIGYKKRLKTNPPKSILFVFKKVILDIFVFGRISYLWTFLIIILIRKTAKMTDAKMSNNADPFFFKNRKKAVHHK